MAAPTAVEITPSDEERSVLRPGRAGGRLCKRWPCALGSRWPRRAS
jgi:hypothetical protein